MFKPPFFRHIARVAKQVEALVSNTRSVSSTLITGTMETKPHHDYRKYEWHWLWADRAWSPSMAQWLEGKWHCIGEATPITPEEMRRRGWLWLAPAIPPPTPQDDGIKPKIPDFGEHTETIEGQYPITITCKYVVPGKTFSDLLKIFREAEKPWVSSDNLSANPSKWQNSRGVSAVLNTILEAVYLHNPPMRIETPD